ncbi:uncharacterized protein B0I36DRAFT_344966 [Microdochium trichocladiopsis]|uniref:DUF7719 domain-containing protein n=1 Tax=Microdochium trichocladiopsis TaxID=1682393 RepID=A0A9P9C0Q7_9PEZI|nr:uncharacterized protein B0I36DRAFT_344966 [Microdochium trichocladiopsis]KAH7041354.1 hypothetical protein B0I36DRAFT_344966 [Microdochium trichocladiopsis]
MVVTRKEKKAANPNYKLAQPDKSGPTGKTLLDIAQERNLFAQADKRQAKLARGADRSDSDSDGDDADGGVGDAVPTSADRLMEAVLWSVSLTMLHFTLDVLVHKQYAMDFSWYHVIMRSAKIVFIFLLFFYVLHPHASAPDWIPGLPRRFQEPLRQAIFFATSVASSCHLVHITNEYGYLFVLKRSPPLGCLWVWAVIELDLPVAVASLACTGAFFWQGGYNFDAPK